ncbi:hypothetical protein SVAN01_04969 [Stagonosporopsis vannaccii]|nr:hypothetical protein SVAN01_04969 [Stagonosporopsis vannaccii]
MTLTEVPVETRRTPLSARADFLNYLRDVVTSLDTSDDYWCVCARLLMEIEKDMARTVETKSAPPHDSSDSRRVDSGTRNLVRSDILFARGYPFTLPLNMDAFFPPAKCVCGRKAVKAGEGVPAAAAIETGEEDKTGTRMDSASITGRTTSHDSVTVSEK